MSSQGLKINYDVIILMNRNPCCMYSIFVMQTAYCICLL